MDKQAWSRQASAAAVVLAATMLVTIEAQAYPFDDGIAAGTGSQVTTGGAADDGSTIDEADPTDDGFIIIECVGFDGRAMPQNEADNALMLHAVSMPQYPLGPSKCWPGEHKRMP